MITYKGYFGTVQYSAEDKVFWGTIHGINDVVTFESSMAIDLEPAFHEAVDDYLQTCQELGKKPEKTFKGNFNVRIKPLLHKRLYETSIENNISLNSALERQLEKSYA